MIRALIFDCDGLLFDSETMVYQSWQEIYYEHHCELPFEKWIRRVGGSTADFDAHTYLETLLDRPLSRIDLDRRRIQRQWELLEHVEPFPGVVAYLKRAKERDLKIGLASSSERSWVEGHIKRLGIDGYFDCIKCGDDVQRVKPHPELYQAVLTDLNVKAEHAIAFEDSPNGIRAAQDAGLFCVVVPNTITIQTSLAHADMRLASLEELSLDDLLEMVESLHSFSLSHLPS